MATQQSSPPPAAVIDIGSATVHLLATAWEPNGKLLPIAEASERPLLGSAISATGELPAAVVALVASQLQELVKLAHQHGCKTIIVVATEAVRSARNAGSASATWEAATGIPVTILTPAEETALAVAGALGAYPQSGMLFADSGGGSTQVAVVAQGAITYQATLPLGAATLTERYFLHDPPEEGEWAAARAAVAERLVPLPLVSPSLPAVATGGSAITLAMIPCPGCSNEALTRRGVALACLFLQRWPSARSATQLTLPPERARIAPAGALIWQEIIRWSRHDVWRVSRAGLREGVLTAWFRTGERWLEDVREKGGGPYPVSDVPVP
ncbi:MAG: hypothetical protein M1118_08145 [Chloroflexi bacterium]|nr:hypothetical protein [Chloroflexota bacterium]